MFERRLQTLLIVLALACLALVVRAFSLQVVGHSDWSQKAENLVADERQTPTVRGRILDVKGRELAIDQPCIDACVHFQAVTATPDLHWLQSIARARVKKHVENYTDLPLGERKKLLAAEVERVKADIETMWRDLARLSGKREDELDDLRAQIVRRVEVQRRLVWYAKSRATTQAAEPTWYAKLLGAGPSEPAVESVHVGEERDVHIVLPNIDYALRNELARRLDRYPGLVLREGVLRKYPYGSVACHVIGRIGKVAAEDLVADPRRNDPLGKYAATDDIGCDGLEKLLEPQLRGTRGLVTNADDTDTPADPNNPDADAKPAETRDLDPVPGQDVRTTLDIELQKRIEQAFKTVQFIRKGDLPPDTLDMPGAAVVIDVASGEVRAMASWPTYDLNRFNELYPQLRLDRINQPLMNRATWLDVEPGSTVKPMVGISAITAGFLQPHEAIPCDGYMVLNGRQIKIWGKCWTMRMYGKTHEQLSNPPAGDPLHHQFGDAQADDALTFPEALQRSCNVFHETVANRMGIGQLSFWFDKFGLGRPTGVGLPERKGLLPDSYDGPPARKQAISCLAGIGEDQVHATPIQMANVAATIARNGLWMRPTLRVDDRPEQVDLHLSPVALAEAHQGMYAVVNTPAGTGNKAVYMPDIVVAAKTGSAQTAPLTLTRVDDQGNPVRDPQGKVIHDTVALGTHDSPNPGVPWYRALIGRGPDKVEREDVTPPHGWMIGYAPADHPKVAFAVLVEYGGGGSAAGGIVKQALEACKELGYLN